jgi:uncharacterized protein (TIGR02466 family)
MVYKERMATDKDGWMAGADVLSLFPTLVWKIRLKSAQQEEISAQISPALTRMRRESTESAADGGWQSMRELHELAEFSDLVSCINRAIESVLRFLKIGYDEFEITGCWANVNRRGASHRIHSHPNNFLSGVYYVQTADGADTINFHDPRTQTGVIRPPVTELTRENTDQAVVKVSAGTLLVFPSYLQHSVDENQSDTERLSVSFNVMFNSFAERMSKPLW